MKPIKGKISQITTCSKEYKIVTNPDICEPYWDEGYNYYRSKGKRKLKKIFVYQVRMYRTWKYNRKKQWK